MYLHYRVQHTRQNGIEEKTALQTLQLVPEERLSRIGDTDERGWSRGFTEAGLGLSGQHGSSTRWECRAISLPRHRW